MTSSKFIEILDASTAPLASSNVSLADTLAQSRQRSPSSSSSSDNDKSPTGGVSASHPFSPQQFQQQIKTRLRRLSWMKPAS
nr:hypothetical protein CFP56_12126 [Quercus suber]